MFSLRPVRDDDYGALAVFRKLLYPQHTIIKIAMIMDLEEKNVGYRWPTL